MSNDSRQRAYKARGGGGGGGGSGHGSGVSSTQPATVQPAVASLVQATSPSLTLPSTQPGLTQRVVRQQAGAAFLQSPCLHADSLVQTHSQTATMTHNNATNTHVQPQALGQTHTLTQVDSLAVAQSHGMVQVNPRPLAQSLVYAHPQVLTQSQVHTQSQMQTQPHVHTQIQPQTQPYMQAHAHSQVQSQSQLSIQPHLNTNAQMQIQPSTPGQTHMQIPSQLTQVPLQTQLSTVTQASVINTLPDIMNSSQIESCSSQHSSKVSGGSMEVVTVPVSVSRQHSGLQDLPHHPSSATITEVPPTTSQTQLLHTLNTFPLADQLTTAISLQHTGSTLTQTLTQSQLLDALGVERVLMPSRNNLGQTMIPQESSVELEGLSVLPLSESFSGRQEHAPTSANTSAPLPIKASSVSEASTTVQLPISQVSATSQQLSAPLTSALGFSQESLIKSLSLKPPTTTPATTTSSLIASNRMLNKLLDTTKPHIPSQVTKAAEIAHLIPTVRPAPPRLGERDDGLDPVFTTSSRTPVSLTRTSLPTPSTIATTLRTTGSIMTETVTKAVSSVPNDGIFGLPSNFQVNNATVVLPNSVSHGQIISQRDIDSVQQVYSGSLPPTNLTEQQLEGLSTEVLKVLPTTLKVCHMTPTTSCATSGVSSSVGVSCVEKNSKKTCTSSTSQVISNPKSFSTLTLPDGMNKGGLLLDSLTKFQGNSCMKSSLITSTDPMFPSVMMTSGCSSPTSLGTTIITKPSASTQEVLGRGKSSTSDTRAGHQTLADLLARGPGSDVIGGSGGGGMPLLGLSESRLSHTADVLLSELHRSDESDLSLGATLSAASGEELHNNTSGLTAEASLVTGIGDSAPLQDLPSPPLPSFSLPNITADFMVSGVSGSKTCTSTQPHLPTLLSNLATTADLDQFLENSNMCIDMSSLSESEVSLSTGAGTFAYSPEKPGTSKKSASSTSSDLTFTSALKAATTKCDNDDIIESPKLSDPVQVEFSDTSKLLLDVPKETSVPSTSDSSQSLLGHSSSVSQDRACASSKKSHAQAQTKASQGQSEKRKEMFRKNELLVQQVACFKCRLCSFLSQDKSEMVSHMKDRHSQYLSDTDESEDEPASTPTSKRVKVLVPKGDSQTEGASAAPETRRVTRAREGTNKHKVNQEDSPSPESDQPKKCFIKKEVEDSSGRIGIFIKSEPKDVGLFEGRLINRDEEEDFTSKVPDEAGQTASPESDQEVLDEDTNDSGTTTDSGNVKQPQKRPTRPVVSKTTPPTLNKKKTSKGAAQDDSLGIRCDVNGCGLRLKSESNIAYHRKCHVNSMLQCQECYATKFQSWRDLALHLWRQHLIDMELHKCDKCDYKSYSYSKLMNVHHKIHSDERPSLCDTCGKRFKTPKQLRNHKALHMKKNDAPQHQCEICQRPFSDKRMLRNHQESVHKKVKPFLCNYCGYSTASRSTLKMHMRQHTGEKPFACEKCKYRTSDHNSLRRHKMQHTGVRPYRCPYCDYASIQSTTFKVHLKDKHPGLAQLDGIMFTCGVCSFKTVKRDNYLAHVAEHSRADAKRMRQAAYSVIPIRKPQHKPDAILSDLTPPAAPHVVNIDVNSGTFTVESPNHSDFLNAVAVQTPVPGQIIMADQYIYAVDSSVLSQVRSGESMVQLGEEVVGVPLSLPLQASGTASSLQGLMYVTTSTQSGQ